MATCTTDKPVNLYQLGIEIGGGIGLRSVGPDEDGNTRVTTLDVEQADLDTAITAHVADPAIVPEVEPAADLPALIANARNALADATTMAELRARTLDLFDLINPVEVAP